MHIAIVGSGVSGLGTAWYLSTGGHELTVLESADTLGGHAQSCVVEVPHAGGRARVTVNPAYDIFNEHTYPRFTALLAELDAPTAPREFSYTYQVADARDPSRTAWTVRMPTLLNLRNLAQLRRRGYRRFVRVAVRLGRHLERLAQAPDPTLTWRALLADAEVPDDLVTRFFLPAFARPWGVKPADVASMPASIVGGWTRDHRTLTPRPLPWRSNVGGAGAYVQRWVARLRQRGVELQAGQAVESVRSTGRGPEVRCGGQWRRFDHVVLATNARQALALLASPTPAQRQVLGAFRYQSNQVIVHSDLRLAPARRRDWSYFNVRYDPTLDETYNSIWFGQDTGAPVFAVNHRVLPHEPRHVHATFRFEQPIFDPETPLARARLGELQGLDGLWFCGVYAHGTGHHEDGLASAAGVAAGLATAHGAG